MMIGIWKLTRFWWATGHHDRGQPSFLPTSCFFRRRWGCQSIMRWGHRMIAKRVSMILVLSLRLYSWHMSKLLERQKIISKQHKRNKETYDRKHQSKVFEVGTRVLLENTLHKQRKGGKLNPFWLGPYTINRDLGKGQANVARLKEYQERPRGKSACTTVQYIPILHSVLSDNLISVYDCILLNLCTGLHWSDSTPSNWSYSDWSPQTDPTPPPQADPTPPLQADPTTPPQTDPTPPPQTDLTPPPQTDPTPPPRHNKFKLSQYLTVRKTLTNWVKDLGLTLEDKGCYRQMLPGKHITSCLECSSPASRDATALSSYNSYPSPQWQMPTVQVNCILSPNRLYKLTLISIFL